MNSKFTTYTQNDLMIEGRRRNLPFDPTLHIDLMIECQRRNIEYDLNLSLDEVRSLLEEDGTSQPETNQPGGLISVPKVPRFNYDSQNQI